MQELYNISMKVNKYDRQIRLWGIQGQKRLSQAKAALLGCSGSGIEALKNLILPGVGYVDIWDTRIVTLQDLSSSFFYAPEDIGKPRAVAASANLLEMNPDVRGEAFCKPISELLGNHQLLKQYSLLVVGDLSLQQQSAVSKVCWQLDITVVFVTVIGFYVYVRNQRRVHVVEFQRTTAKKYYLRLHDPFPALQKHASQWNIVQLMSKIETVGQEQKKKVLHELENIPYPIILMQANQCLPKEKQNRAGVQELIKEWGMMVGEGRRDNFSQAASRYFDFVQTPDNFLRGLDRFECQFVREAGPTSPQPLIFLKACGQFLKRKGHLPQLTDLPDMETQTVLYLALKKVYRQQHEKNVEEMLQLVKELFGKELLSKQVISEYINNIEAIQVLELSPYFKQLEFIDNPNLQWLDPQWRHILLAIRAQALFVQKEKRQAGVNDYQAVKTIAESIKSQFGFEQLSEERYLQQVCRVQGKTTISINSIAGAIAGQQSIKLISHCFTPVKDGFVFSGVHGVGFPVQLV